MILKKNKKKERENIVFKYHFSNQNLSNSIIHANGV